MINIHFFHIFRCADGGIFADTQLKQAMEDQSLGVPGDAPYPNDHVPMPFTIIADDAFPLRRWLLKPYQQRDVNRDQRIFNYRLCRARRIVENAFGILANRWRVLLTTMQIAPQRSEAVILAACALNNLILTDHPNLNRRLADREDSVTHDITQGEWRNGPAMEQLEALRGNTSSNAGKAVRQYLTNYFVSDVGAVPWQEEQSRIVN